MEEIPAFNTAALLQQEVERVIEDSIRGCETSDSKYMQAKLKKIVEGQELSNTLNAEYSCVYCFVDRSKHSGTVWHLNVLMPNGKVLIFRLGNKILTPKDCTPMLELAKAMVEVGEITGKGVVLGGRNYGGESLKSKNLCNDDEQKQWIGETLKGLRTDDIRISHGYLRIGMYLGKGNGFDNTNRVWKISVKMSDVRDCLPAIVERIKVFKKSLKKIDSRNIKGLMSNFAPHF